MKYEIDHVFILVSTDAPESQLLNDFGLSISNRRVHHGQGTKNICYQFENMMLELLWVNNPQHAQSARTRATTLWPRWQNRHTCSAFGLCLRSTDSEICEPAFKAWKYQPEYFPQSKFVYLADSVTELHEPLIFFMPNAVRNEQQTTHYQTPHAIGFKQLSGLKMCNRQNDYSDAFTSLLENNIISLNSDLANKIVLQFDGAKSNNRKDFSPTLPLIIEW